jgi:hypothetical protein
MCTKNLTYINNFNSAIGLLSDNLNVLMQSIIENECNIVDNNKSGIIENKYKLNNIKFHER